MQMGLCRVNLSSSICHPSTCVAELVNRNWREMDSNQDEKDAEHSKFRVLCPRFNLLMSKEVCREENRGV